MLAGVNKTGGQHRADVQLLPNLTRVSRLALISRNHRRGAHHERTNAREFGNHRVGQRELVKTRRRIVMEIAETKNRKTLLFLVRNGDLRRFVDALFGRSEERRVGKECRSRWSPYQ